MFASAPVSWAATDASGIPRHIAIIMDGNGRWAEERGLPRAQGHQAGVEALRRVVRAAGELGVRYLTLYSFSSENWSRPDSEIAQLMELLKRFIRNDLVQLHRNNVRVRVIGSRQDLRPDILALLAEAEEVTRENDGQTVLVAFNYGARDEIARAAQRIALKVSEGSLDPTLVDEACIESHLDTAGVPDPDLLIRTSGERRLSNFLLWQCAYTEFVFLPIYWPDFDEAALTAALDEFRLRQRRFGGLVARSAS